MSKKVYGPPRTDFGPPPPGYIPGIGRGATGFTTRSDIGPAAERGVIIPERGMGPAEIQRLREREENLNEQNYDEFTGYGGSLFSGKYTAEDVEADRVYAEVDERRNVQRKRKEAEESNLSPAELAMLAVKRSKGQIVSDLKSLKKELSAVSETEWEALPDAVDLTRRPKQGSGRETLAAVPDSVLLGGSVAAALEAATGGSLSTTVVDDEVRDITEVARAREKTLALSLATLAGDSGATDTSAYVDGLDAQPTVATGDVKKLRLLYKSVIQSNPTHAPGWIAAARLERDAGKAATAKQLIHKACENCPKSEDVWLEAIDLYAREGASGLATAHTVAVNALRCLPLSSQLWRRAAALETIPTRQQAVLRKALEQCPNDEELWRAAVRLEEPAGAIALLGKAVEALPQCVDFWLALARLESYDNAKRVLNRARQVCPDSVDVWLGACLLEEDRMVSEAESATALRVRAVEEARGGRVKAEMADDGNLSSLSSSSSSSRLSALDDPEFYDEELAGLQPQWADAAHTCANLGTVDRIARIALKTLLKYPCDSEKSKKPDEERFTGSSEKREEKPSRGLLSREQWLQRMRQCEDNRQYITCAALAGTASLVGLGKFEPENVDASGNPTCIPGITVPLDSVTSLTRMLIRRTLRTDAQTLASEGYHFCAKALLHTACVVAPDDDDSWMAYIGVLQKELELWQRGPENRVRNLWIGKYREMGDSLYSSRGLIPPEKRPSEWSELPVHCTREILYVLEKSVEASPENISSWLHLAKLSRSVFSVAKARAVLARGFETSPNAADLWLAAAKLEAEHGLVARATTIYRTAFATTSSTRVAVKFAKLLRAVGRATLSGGDSVVCDGRGWAALSELAAFLEGVLGVAWEADAATLLTDQVQEEKMTKEGKGRVRVVKGANWKVHRTEAKLWMLLGQLYADNARQSEQVGASGSVVTGARAFTRAREIYRAATRTCPNSEALWVQAAALEVDGVLGANVRPAIGLSSKTVSPQAIARARAILDAARTANPASGLIWRALCRTEALAGPSAASAVSQHLARALQVSGDKALLYEYAVAREAPVQRRGRVAEALSKCGEDARACCLAARLFWSEGKYGKARGWFEKAVTCGAGGSAQDAEAKAEDGAVTAARVAKRGYGDAWIWWHAFETDQLRRAQETLDNQVLALQSLVATSVAGIKAEDGVKIEEVRADKLRAIDENPNVIALKEEVEKAKGRVEALLHLCESAMPSKGDMWTALSKRDKVDVGGVQSGLRPTVEDQTGVYEGIKVLSWSPQDIVVEGSSQIKDMFGHSSNIYE